MPDITMCRPIDGCERRNECYRYRAIPNERQSQMCNMCGGNSKPWPDNFREIPIWAELSPINWQE